VSTVAFGLSLEIDVGIEVPGIPSVDTPGAYSLDASPSGRSAAHLPPQPPTRVRLDAQELARRWSRARTYQLARQQPSGEAAATIEFAPPAGYLLRVQGMGRILIAQDGTELICDPEPGNSDWAALIPAQALPLAATLRGFEVLHASGVVMQGNAALFTGPSGAGKSSLAAALLCRGAALLSDDAVALELRDGALIAHPGANLLYLRRDEHDRLSTRERAVLCHSNTFLGKQRFGPSASAFPAPLGGLFLLERSKQGAPIEHVEAVDPFALLASTFSLSAQAPDRLTRHLDLAVALAATERIYRLRVRPDMDATQLADVLHEHLLGL
jgi:hypothetical protein